jgi:hypothetical protein
MNRVSTEVETKTTLGIIEHFLDTSKFRSLEYKILRELNEKGTGTSGEIRSRPPAM